MAFTQIIILICLVAMIWLRMPFLIVPVLLLIFVNLLFARNGYSETAKAKRLSREVLLGVILCAVLVAVVQIAAGSLMLIGWVAGPQQSQLSEITSKIGWEIRKAFLYPSVILGLTGSGRFLMFFQWIILPTLYGTVFYGIFRFIFRCNDGAGVSR